LYDLDYIGLKTFLDTTAVLQDTTEISKLAGWLSNKCDVKTGNYQNAISWYENIIDNPENENDSTFAIIDLGYVYQLMQDSSQRQSINCRYPEYNIPVRKQYETYRDELLDRLWDKETALGVPENEQQNNTVFSGISVFPNPVNDHLKLEFVLKQSSNIGIYIYDHCARLVQQTGFSEFAKGGNTFSIDISALPPGIYNCMLKTTDGQIITKKIVKH
jgi:Secretion system C-terminal sorting domain